MGNENLEIKRIKVTPSMARKWLESQKNYRKLRPFVLRSYKADMKSGFWTDCGDTIKLDTHGRLVDGQHRLQAIVDLDLTMHFWVAKGVKNMLNIDNGSPRNASDALGFELSLDCAKDVTGTYRKICRFGLMNTASKWSGTKSELVKFVKSNPFIVDAAQKGAEYKKKGLITSTEVGAAIMQAHYCKSDMAIVFGYFESIRDGLELKKGDPSHTIREKLAILPVHGSKEWKMRMWCILRGLRAKQIGEQVAVLRYSPECPMPQLVPK